MEQESARKISILLVDDEKLVRNSFRRELWDAGFTVTAVASGIEALAEVEKSLFDTVITDLSIPDIDGFEVLQAVKRKRPQTRVIILTGYGDEQSISQARRLGADDFILKPCEVDELISRIRSFYQNRSYSE